MCIGSLPRVEDPTMVSPCDIRGQFCSRERAHVQENHSFVFPPCLFIIPDRLLAGCCRLALSVLVVHLRRAARLYSREKRNPLEAQSRKLAAQSASDRWPLWCGVIEGWGWWFGEPGRRL